MAITASNALYVRRRGRNLVARLLAYTATAFGLGWLVLILGVLIGAAVPTFLGATRPAADRRAESILHETLLAGRALALLDHLAQALDFHLSALVVALGALHLHAQLAERSVAIGKCLLEVDDFLLEPQRFCFLLLARLLELLGVHALRHLVARLGESLDLGRETLSFLSIERFMRMATDSASNATRTELLRASTFETKRHELACALRLPPVIASSRDVRHFRQEDTQPNFITSLRVAAPVAEIPSTA